MIKDLARHVMASPAVYPLLRQRARWQGSTAIMTYHTLGPDDESQDAWTVVRVSDFLRQVEVLRRTHTIVSLDQMVDEPLHEAPRAVLTFDDGHEGWATHLLPILARESLPIALYVATGHIESGRVYWFDRVMNAVQVQGSFTLDLQRFGLGRRAMGRGRPVDQWNATSSLLEALKRADDAQRDACASAIEAQTRDLTPRRVTPLRPLTVAQLQALAQSRWVTMGSHSHDHRLLDQVPIAQAVESIARSRALIREWCGLESMHFAYPNGNHHSALAQRVAQLGFRTAVTTRVALHRPGDDLHRLPRLAVGRYDSINRFKLALVEPTRTSTMPRAA